MRGHKVLSFRCPKYFESELEGDRKNALQYTDDTEAGEPVHRLKLLQQPSSLAQTKKDNTEQSHMQRPIFRLKKCI